MGKIEKIERVEELKSPEWERQTGESELWHGRFLIYYLGQIGNKEVRTAVITWAKANDIWDEARIQSEYRLWKQIAERNLWLERELAYEEYRGSLITTQEYDVLTTFKNQGLRLNQSGMKSAIKAVKTTAEIFEDYTENLARNERGNIEFGEMDVNQYSKLVSAMKMSVDTANTMVEIGNKILALDKVLAHLLESDDNSMDARLIEGE